MQTYLGCERTICNSSWNGATKSIKCALKLNKFTDISVGLLMNESVKFSSSIHFLLKRTACGCVCILQPVWVSKSAFGGKILKISWYLLKITWERIYTSRCPKLFKVKQSPVGENLSAYKVIVSLIVWSICGGIWAQILGENGWLHPTLHISNVGMANGWEKSLTSFPI